MLNRCQSTGRLRESFLLLAANKCHFFPVKVMRANYINLLLGEMTLSRGKFGGLEAAGGVGRG